MTEGGRQGRGGGASSARRSTGRTRRGEPQPPRGKSAKGSSAQGSSAKGSSAQGKSAQGKSAQGRPQRARRAGRPGRAIGRNLFGLTTTRRAAILAIVVCALALSVAVPLRTYLSQRADVEVQEQRQAELRAKVQQLEERKAQLSDPAQVQAEARTRLRYVMPGETPYIVQLPGDQGTQPGGQPTPPPTPQQPWFQELWNSITGSG